MVGADPREANLIKLLGNMMTATTLEMLAETTAVLPKARAGPAIVRGDHDQHDVRWKSTQDIRRQDCSAGLRARVHVASRAQGRPPSACGSGESGTPMPSVGIVRDRLITAIARGYGALDWTVLGQIAAEEAGIAPLQQPLPKWTGEFHLFQTALRVCQPGLAAFVSTLVRSNLARSQS